MKERLDLILVREGFYDTREKAKRAIMAGIVLVNDIKIDKAGTLVDMDKNPQIRIKGEKLKYVSRGGLKLEKALENFEINMENKRILDIGASTGGFTDCSLQNRANFVYAVDVGTNQLVYSLRENPKVKSIENRHIKDLTLEELDKKIKGKLSPDFLLNPKLSIQVLNYRPFYILGEEEKPALKLIEKAKNANIESHIEN